MKLENEVILYDPRLPNTWFLEVFGGTQEYTDQTPFTSGGIWKPRVMSP